MARAAKRTRDAVAHASSEATAAPRRSAGAGSSDPLVGDLRRGGLLPLLVLHFAAQEACYGNQLIERIATVTDGTVAVNPNTMYPLLRRLEGQGLIRGHWEHPERRTRRLYSITAEGREDYARIREEVEPFLDSVQQSIGAIRREVYGE